jgi:hypothetical protein
MPCRELRVLAGADSLRQTVALLRFVEAGLAAPPERRAFEPVENEQRAFDTADLAQREVELTLAFLGGELIGCDRGRDRHG